MMFQPITTPLPLAYLPKEAIALSKFARKCSQSRRASKLLSQQASAS